MEIIRKIYLFLLDTVQTILIAGSIFLVIYMFLFRPFEVNGESMLPNFKDKEYVLTNLITLRVTDLKRGDVIVFKAPDQPDKDYIKRVIGLPGDVIELKNGNIFINGKQIDEHAYLNDSVKTYNQTCLQETQGCIKDNIPLKVSADSYFVLGDNRGNSADSRYFGFVPKSAVIGKSMFIYWPISDMKQVKNPYE